MRNTLCIESLYVYNTMRMYLYLHLRVDGKYLELLEWAVQALEKHCWLRRTLAITAFAVISAVTEAIDSSGCYFFHGKMMNRYGQTLPVAVSLQIHGEEKSQYIICTVQVLR